ncbi:sulfur oxidation c-type cytochrome SoxA [Tepidamorphus sp. 3E244]|uniref:sulfur oxidation c-type cytochrome SoxA n=1 Tax=Tepidamorphus sp. 3E244 TaxID=3385498 RepID=UPI0038FCE5C4
MKKLTYAAAGLAIAGLVTAGAVSVSADDEPKLIIEGQEMTTVVAVPEDHPLSPEIKSGWEYRSKETQVLETDDFQNPAMLTAEVGQDLWASVDGSEGKSCESCHGDASESMKGVRANMPKWNEAANKPLTLEETINDCRTERMGAEAWKWESQQMLGMTSYVGLQSRGMPMQVQTDGPMASWVEKGKDLYYTRVGQLDLSCANCHENNYGNYIRADRLSQGMINGFPTYRLKWSGVGSIHRRFKGCMDQVRATPYKRGSDEFVALEVYLASRGAGLSIESPAVRN